MFSHFHGMLRINRLLVHSALRKPDTSPLLQVHSRNDDQDTSSSSFAPGSRFSISSIPTLESSSAVSQEAFLLTKEPIFKRFSLRACCVSSNFPSHTRSEERRVGKEC